MVVLYMVTLCSMHGHSVTWSLYPWLLMKYYHCIFYHQAAESSNIPVDLLHQVKADRTTDPLYCATTTLVQGIVDLNGSVQQGHTESLVGSAKVSLKHGRVCLRIELTSKMCFCIAVIGVVYRTGYVDFVQWIN